MQLDQELFLGTTTEAKTLKELVFKQLNREEGVSISRIDMYVPRVETEIFYKKKWMYLKPQKSLKRCFYLISTDCTDSVVVHIYGLHQESEYFSPFCSAFSKVIQESRVLNGCGGSTVWHLGIRISARNTETPNLITNAICKQLWRGKNCSNLNNSPKQSESHLMYKM